MHGQTLGDGKYDRWEKLAEVLGLSQGSVANYIVLNNLTDGLMDLVDEGRIHLKPATVIARLSDETQEGIFRYYTESIRNGNGKGVTPSHMQAKEMLTIEKNTNDSLNYDVICNILKEKKANQVEKKLIPEYLQIKYFSDCKEQADYERKIVEVFEFYFRHHGMEESYKEEKTQFSGMGL